MRRELDSLTEKKYDLCIIGGGIYGAMVALEAALRGLSVVLIDQGDFGSATSHNSLKLIHGGLRYLQHLDFRRVRQSVLERRYWLTNAPHLTRPLGILMPLMDWGLRGPVGVWSGMRLHELIGYDRNNGVLPLSSIPRGRLLSRDELISAAPGLRHLNPVGGALWYDGQMIDSDRLLLESIIAAEEAGARVCNYIRAEKLSFNRDGTIGAVEAVDQINGREIILHSSAVINASGPWASEFLSQRVRVGLNKLIPAMTRNMNVVVPKFIEGSLAITVPSRRDSDAIIAKQNRLFFVTPWKQCSIIGTMHEPYEGKVDHCRFDDETVFNFLSEFNEAYPDSSLSINDVRYVYGGLTPAEGIDNRGNARRSRHGMIIDHGLQDGLKGLYSIVGVKYTTARLIAERVVAMAVENGLSARAPSGVSARIQMPGSRGFRDFTQITNSLIEQCRISNVQAQDLAEVYGVRANHVLSSLNHNEHISDIQILQAKVRFAVYNEMAVRLSDFVFRRSTLAEEGQLNEDALTIIAKTMEKECNWDAVRTRAEIASIYQSDWRNGSLGIYK